jgi:hypothetical protein
MIQHILQSNSWEETTKMFRVQVYPAKNPNGRYVNKDQQGQTYDTYLVFDSNKSWRLGKDWRRIIKAEGVNGYYTISTKRVYKSLDQHDKDVIAYINTHYPLPQ